MKCNETLATLAKDFGNCRDLMTETAATHVVLPPSPVSPTPRQVVCFGLPKSQTHCADEKAAWRFGYATGWLMARCAIMRLKELGYGRPQEINNIMGDFHRDVLVSWMLELGTTKVTDEFPHFDYEAWKVKRARILARNCKCVLCGSTDDLEVDHELPVMCGGSPEEDNLRTLCSKCNTQRNTGLMAEIARRRNVRA